MTVQHLGQEKDHYEQLYRRSGDHHFIGAGYEELHHWTIGRLTAPATVLDIGSGSGQHARRIAQAGHHVTGVELSETAVAIARRVFRESGLEGSFHCGDARALPFTDRSFDASFLSLILHHFLDPDPVLSEAARVARRWIFVFEPSLWNPQSFALLNLLNRCWRVPFLTPNQRAVSPRRVVRQLAAHGFLLRDTRYTSLRSTNRESRLRTLSGWCQAWLPAPLRHTKFIQVFERADGSF